METSDFLLGRARYNAGFLFGGDPHALFKNHCAEHLQYTSAIKRSTIAMNGHDCDVSMHDAVRFADVM